MAVMKEGETVTLKYLFPSFALHCVCVSLLVARPLSQTYIIYGRIFQNNGFVKINFCSCIGNCKAY